MSCPHIEDGGRNGPRVSFIHYHFRKSSDDLNIDSVSSLERFQFLCELVDRGEACKTVSQRVFGTLTNSFDSQFFAWFVPVWDGKCHSGFRDKVYGVAKVRRDPRCCLAALFCLYTGDGDSSHTFLDQIRLQCGACETVSCVLDHDRLVGSRLEKVHQLERWAVPCKPFILVSMQEEHDGQMRRSVCFD